MNMLHKKNSIEKTAAYKHTNRNTLYAVDNISKELREAYQLQLLITDANDGFQCAVQLNLC